LIFYFFFLGFFQLSFKLIKLFKALQEDEETENNKNYTNNSSDLVGQFLGKFIMELFGKEYFGKIDAR
jgi:hypothetical protein